MFKTVKFTFEIQFLLVDSKVAEFAAVVVYVCPQAVCQVGGVHGSGGIKL